MISQEEIYRLLQSENWKELFDVFYKGKDLIKTDTLLSQALETTLSVITDKAMRLDENKDFVDNLEIILLLDAGRFISLNDQQKEAIIIAIVNGKKDNISYCYLYAKNYPNNEICNRLILEYEKNLPKELNHSQIHDLIVYENKEIVESHDYRKPLFNSLQEVEFFLALKRVFDSYQIYPNVGLSCILDFEKIKNSLTTKEKDFFLKTSIDFAVLEPFRNYFPIYFFELDSLQKVELVMKCEQEYHILINDDDINSDFNNDMLVDLIYNKIIKVIC